MSGHNTGRVYTVGFDGVVPTIGGDFVILQAASSSNIEILSVEVGQSSDAGDAEAEMLQVSLDRFDVQGLGGTALTPAPHNVGHAAAGGAYRQITSTQGHTNRTDVLHGVCQIMAGWFHRPDPDDRVWIPPNGFLSVEVLPTVFDDSLTFSVAVTFVEHD